jgi:hypothetical protein
VNPFTNNSTHTHKLNYNSHLRVRCSYLLANNFTSFSEISIPPRIIKRSTTLLIHEYFQSNRILATFDRVFRKFTAFPCSEAILSAKCEINLGMSSRLSFNEGTFIKIRPVIYKSKLNSFGNFLSNLLFVAAITRTSTLISFSAPTFKSYFLVKHVILWLAPKDSYLSIYLERLFLYLCFKFTSTIFTADVNALHVQTTHSINSEGIAAQLTS